MNANFTVANATRLYDMLNLSDYADYRNAQSGPDDRQFFKSGNEVRYIFSGGKYDETDPTSYRILQERDWQREIYRTAFSQNYSVSVNGGSDKVRYFVSASTDRFTTRRLTCEFVDGLVEDRIGGFVVKRVVEKERYDVG
ncbi:MAG: hypothetical protein BHV68_17430 [Bacteroidales bacterium 43_8]|nr:MAG: hypothetical protein BHV68_17430 [Bacteroidales bacterium 43_8]